jgi:hypothetical protein
MEITIIQDWQEPYARLGNGRDDLSSCYAPYYLNLLSAYLNLEPIMISLSEVGEIIGLLPLFVRNGPAGKVANSLPFFGSYGGCLVDPLLEKESRRGLKKRLIAGLLNWAVEENISLVTVINHPLEEDSDLYSSILRPDLQDERIGQVLPLPQTNDHKEALTLLLRGYKKGRNIVRKGLRLAEVRVDNSIEAFRFLYEVHRENMEAQGGLSKEWAFFETVQRRLEPEREYMLYIGYVDHKPVAACLTLRYGGFIDYFTPVIRREFRSTQALSAVIIRAMQDASVSGYQWWNWGGSWLDQKNLYRFKARWGGQDRRYIYHIKVLEDKRDFIEMGKDELLRSYPFFYTIPFSALGAG